MIHAMMPWFMPWHAPIPSVFLSPTRPGLAEDAVDQIQSPGAKDLHGSEPTCRQWQRHSGNGATMRNGSGGSVKRCEMRERIRKNEIKLDITFTSLWVQLCSTMFNCSHSPNFDQQECEGIFETLCHWEENASWDWDYLRRPETQSRVLAGILGLFGSWFQIHSTPQADRENMTDSETKRHWVVCFFEFFRYQLQVWTYFECWNINNHQLSDIIRKIHSSLRASRVAGGLHHLQRGEPRQAPCGPSSILPGVSQAHPRHRPHGAAADVKSGTNHCELGMGQNPGT